MHPRSGTPSLPPVASHPASPTLPTGISNRHWKRLENAVTPTKQRLGQVLIDNENPLSCATASTSPVAHSGAWPAHPPSAWSAKMGLIHLGVIDYQRHRRLADWKS